MTAERRRTKSPNDLIVDLKGRHLNRAAARARLVRATGRDPDADEELQGLGLLIGLGLNQERHAQLARTEGRAVADAQVRFRYETTTAVAPRSRGRPSLDPALVRPLVTLTHALGPASAALWLVYMGFYASRAFPVAVGRDRGQFDVEAILRRIARRLSYIAKNAERPRDRRGRPGSTSDTRRV